MENLFYIWNLKVLKYICKKKDLIDQSLSLNDRKRKDDFEVHRYLPGEGVRIDGIKKSSTNKFSISGSC